MLKSVLQNGGKDVSEKSPAGSVTLALNGVTVLCKSLSCD